MAPLPSQPPTTLAPRDRRSSSRPRHPDRLDLEHLRGTTLGQAILHYLHSRHPSLCEYESLVLAEMVDLASTDLGRSLLLEDPTEFAEVTVRRAVIVLAEIRVSLRRAVREQCEASEAIREGDDDQDGASRGKS